MFAGILKHKKARPIQEWTHPDDLKAALYPDFQPDLCGYYETEHALMVSGEVFNTPWSHTMKETPLRHDTISVAFWGRLDNRADLANRLGTEGPLSQTSDNALILKGWYAWGEALAEHLRGDFAFAILDGANNTLFLARDRSGIKPLYYWAHPDGILFANTLAAFRKLKHPKPQPDPSWVAHYVMGISADLEKTAFRDVRKVPPGQALTVTNGKLKQWTYHTWQATPPVQVSSSRDWVADYKTQLEATIQGQMHSLYPLGVESSGGIDSSTILAHIARSLPSPQTDLHALGTAHFTQEAKYVLAASQACGVAHNYINTQRSPDYNRDPDHIRRSIQALGYPYEHAMAPAHVPFYEYCRSQNIRTLFSGFGGDEAVTNYARLVTTELWGMGRHFDSITRFPRNRHMPAQLLKSIFPDVKPTQARQPSEEKSFFAAQNMLTDEVLTNIDIDTELNHRRRTETEYRQHNDWIVNGLLTHPAFITRLENCTLMAGGHGVEYRWPLWDAQLIQFYLSTPISERLGPKGVSRYLHRRAITGLVPDAVAWKPSKDMGPALQVNTLDPLHIQKDLKQVISAVPSQFDHIIDLDKLSSCLKTMQSGSQNSMLLHETRKWTRLLRHLTIWVES